MHKWQKKISGYFIALIIFQTLFVTSMNELEWKTKYCEQAAAEQEQAIYVVLAVIYLPFFFLLALLAKLLATSS